MAWFKVDDGFYTHPKVMAIPRGERMACIGLWLTAGVWSAQQLTDGFVPFYMLEEWGAATDYGNTLCHVGLWQYVPEVSQRDNLGQDGTVPGYQFHDWKEYQPQRSEVEQKRNEERQRKAEWRARKKTKTASTSRNGDAPVPEMSHGTKTSGDEVSRLSRPDPTRPDPLITIGGASNEAAPPKQEKRGTRIKPDWMPPQNAIETLRAEYPALDLKAEHQSFVDYWLAKPGQQALKVDWAATWRRWMRKAGKEQAEKATTGYRSQAQIMAAERERAAQQTRAMQGNALNLIEGTQQ